MVRQSSGAPGELRKSIAPLGAGVTGALGYATAYLCTKGPSAIARARRFNSGVIE